MIPLFCPGLLGFFLNQPVYSQGFPMQMLHLAHKHLPGLSSRSAGGAAFEFSGANRRF